MNEDDDKWWSNRQLIIKKAFPKQRLYILIMDTFSFLFLHLEISKRENEKKKTTESFSNYNLIDIKPKNNHHNLY